jgi:hypothetical protein
MDQNFTNAYDLLQKARSTGKLDLLLSQLQKDFARANVSFPLQTPEAVDSDSGEILQALRESLYVLLMEHFDQYLNLMYAVDVPEREFKGIQGTDAVEVATQVASILLKREWKKIELRSR